VRIWSCLPVRKSLAGAERLAAWIVLLTLSSICVEAQDRWKIQFFYDKQDSSFDIRDIQCPSAEHCVAAGVVVSKDGREKGAIVSTGDGGAHWSMADVKENPLSLFFLNDLLGWMVTEHGIWSSDGTAWKKLDGPKGALRVYFLDSSHGYAIGAPGAVYETSDGGKKWAKLGVASAAPADPKHTVYECITFRGQHGIIIGPVSADDNLNSSFVNPRRNSPVVALETFDGGKNWSSRQISFFGEITLAGFAKGDLPVFLVEYPSYYVVASGLIGGALGSNNQKTLFAEKNRAVTGLALLPDGGAIVAAIEPPGNSSQIPIPGKLKIVETDDWKTWHEMDVDYRAVAQRAVAAIADARHKWVATDTGMILAPVSSGTADLHSK